MAKKLMSLLLLCSILKFGYAQQNIGIHFQGVARSENGLIIANKQINLRISILSDTTTARIEYQEIKSVTTNVLGLFYTTIGVQEQGKIITIGNFNEIQWQEENKYLQVEVDPNNSLHFLQAGWERINYVPYSLYALQAKTINTILPIALGGTGVTSLLALLKDLHLEKVDNTSDSVKPLSNAIILALNDKLKKADTISLSNRINLKLNSIDTLKLSNRINFKLNALDTVSLSNRINQKLNSIDTIALASRINTLNNNQPKNIYGVFYDTAKQITSIATATAIKLNYQQIANKITVLNNTANNLTRITVLETAVYELNYNLQFIKSDAGSDEISVWIRKNSAALANSHNTYTIQGAGIKNMLSHHLLFELSANDYIEIYFSIKNANTALMGTVATTSTPSRPATPAASISIMAVN